MHLGYASDVGDNNIVYGKKAAYLVYMCSSGCSAGRTATVVVGVSLLLN